MQSKTAFRFYYFSVHVISALLLVALSFPLYHMGLDAGYFIMYLTWLTLSVFPLFNRYDSIVTRVSRARADRIISPEKINLVLEAETTSRLIDAGFEQILAAFSVKSGKIFIYNHDSDSYISYEQNGQKKRTVRNAPIDRDSPLIRYFSDHNTAVYRRRLSLSSNDDIKLNDEMIRLKGEMAVPVFYYERFLGILLLGERKQRYSMEDISLLCAIATKIGTLFTNSYLWKEWLEKSDIKREYEMGLRVRHNFNSLPSASLDFFEYAVRLNADAEKFFYFSAYPAPGRSCLSIYRQTKSQPGALVFYPLLIPLAQTYARFGNSPSKTVEQTLRLVEEKRLLDGNFPIIQLECGEKLSWSRNGFSAPLMFSARTSDFMFIHDSQGKGEIQPVAGDILIIFDEQFVKKIGMHYEDLLFILRTNADSPAEELAALISGKLSDSGNQPDFFCLLRVRK